MKTELLEINGWDLEYRYSGGKLDTIVLVNGSGGPLISWFGIFDSLAAHYNVLAYNRPGVGKSAKAPVAQTATQMAKDLEQLLSHLSIDGKVILVGHSLGGLLVLRFCLDYPHRIKGVVLLEPSTIWDIENQKILPRDNNYQFSELNHVRDGIDQFKDLSLFPKITIIIGIGMKSSFLYRVFRHRFEARRANLRRLANQLAGSEVVEFSRSGHFPQMSEPKKVIEVIRSAAH